MVDAYDEHPYTQHAYAETHPSRLAAMARLATWKPPSLDGARVLELGCGRGGNLLPMAAGAPATTFVGVDRSERQIADARRVAMGVALPNVTFVCSSFEEFDGVPGSFEFVVCHGVLSWIAPAARASLLERIAKWLSRGGVAYVSFNVLPGWYERLGARDWLRFASTSLGAAPETASRWLQWLSDQASQERTDYRRRLREIALRLEETDPAYARHEYLANEHFPILVQAFLNEASAAGLTYLGDAIPATTALELLPEQVQQQAAALGVAETEQLVDFVRCTAFRRALLVRADEARVRAWHAPGRLDRGALRSMVIASRLRPNETIADSRPFETFEDGVQTVQVSNRVLRRALHELARSAPAAVSFDALAARALEGLAAPPSGMLDSLAAELLDLWLATSAIDLLSAPPALSPVAGDRPVACPLARWQAAHGGVVTNRLHQEVQVPDAIVRWVLARLDGTHSRQDLAREARSLGGAGDATDAEVAPLVAACLDRLVACALVVGSVNGPEA